MRKIRVSLRHTGSPKFQFGVSRGYYSDLHYNLFFGRFFLVIREKRPNEVPRQLIELDMGRAMLKNRRLWASMTDYEIDLYTNFNPNRYRLDYFLKMIRSK